MTSNQNEKQGIEEMNHSSDEILTDYGFIFDKLRNVYFHPIHKKIISFEESQLLRGSVLRAKRYETITGIKKQSQSKKLFKV